MEWQGQLIQLLTAALVLIANAGIGLLYMMMRSIKHSQERQWDALDAHRLNRELHPDVAGRVERLERLANGRQT